MAQKLTKKPAPAALSAPDIPPAELAALPAADKCLPVRDSVRCDKLKRLMAEDAARAKRNE